MFPSSRFFILGCAGRFGAKHYLLKIKHMTLKKHIIIALAAIIFLTGGAIASAQTSSTTDTVVPTSVVTPGTPDTGAGGDATTNWAILAVTGAVVLGGVLYLVRKPQSQADAQ
jgi:hypothetical protein